MGTSADGTDLSVITDKLDYAPGEDVTLTISGVTAGGSVTIAIADDVSDPGDDGDADTYSAFTATDGGAGDLDGIANGTIVTTWSVPTNGDPNNATLNVAVTDWGSDGALGGTDDRVATTSFTDAVNAGDVRIDQWSNGPAPDADGVGAQNEIWQNGNLNSNSAHYAEGEAVPYRAVVDDLEAGVVYTLVIQWDTLQGSAYALDYLTTYDFSFSGTNHPLEPDPVPTTGVTDLSSATVQQVAIASDSQLLTGFNTGATTDGLGSGTPSGTQYFTVFGSTSNLSTGPITYNADFSQASTTITFTYTGSETNTSDSVVIAWGGHIASTAEWNDDPGENVETASDISGSPYHMRLLSIIEDGTTISLGNQDRSLSADAVTPPPTGSITVVKDALPNDLQDFTFTTTGTGLTKFTLDDDSGVGGGDATHSNTETFTGLTSGVYTIDELAVDGWALTGISIVETGGVANSTFDLATGIVTINLEAGENLTITYSNTKLASLSGYKYNDLNGDGDRDSGDVGLAGWTIKLLVKDPLTGLYTDTGKTANTDANGYYEFAGLAPGDYSTEEVQQDGWAQSDPSSPETLSAGENDTTGNDFGNYQKGKVNGYKYLDINGDGTRDADGVDDIRGTSDDEGGVAGITIELYSKSDLTTVVATTTTNANGFFSFGDLAPGDYVVKEIVPAGSGTAISTTSEFTIESGDTVKLGYVFGNYEETSLNGYKYHDLNADGDRDAEDVGLGGWTINLYKDGVFVKSVVTADGSTDANGDGTIDANDVGYYAFTGLAPGNYTTAEAQQAGWSQSGFSTAETLTSGERDTYGNDFGNYQKGKITGEKYIDNDANGCYSSCDVLKAGWSVSLYNDVNGDGKYDGGDTLVTTTTTNAYGTYTFDALDPGKYVVVESTPAGWYTKANSEYGVTIESGETYGDSSDEKTDFFNYQLGCLSGYKYYDKNHDGCRDKNGADNVLGTKDDEVGLAGWTIQLFKDGVFTGKTAVTDANGFYKFTGLEPGNYTTQEVLKSGWVQTDPSSAETLKSGEYDRYGNDFGNYKPIARIDLDKKVYSVTGGHKDKYGDWVADSAGDVINYKFVLKNTGNLDLTNIVLKDYFESSTAVKLSNATVTGDYGIKGVLEVGETWTYSLKHTVTQAELNAARKVVTEVQKIGFFDCYVKKCTGDLQLDNFAKVWAKAYVPYAEKVVSITDADFETVNVNCPSGTVDGNYSTYGGSTAENLWQQYQVATHLV
ncbi:MAG: hypothetical protein IPL91_06005 [Hyphomicrobium sp.]|nr:hypothetical protein [Hyphomicrobium sp.]